MSVILSHPTGNNNVRQALKALDDSNLLGQFFTTISWNERAALSKLLPARVQAQLSRRSYDESLRDKTTTSSFKEWGRMLASNLNLSWLTRHETGAMSIDSVCQSLDRFVAQRVRIDPKCNAVYCYEDSAMNTFSVARERGIKTIYEHPVGYWREVQRMFEEERERQPAFRAIIAGIQDSEKKRERKDKEISMADLILVPSKYSARTLQQFPHQLGNIQIVNYGSPNNVQEEVTSSGSKVLRVLFVGSLQQRKGLSYLVEACRLAHKMIDVTVIGSRVADCAPVDKWLEGCRWHPSMPHAKVLEVMRECDVLVLPSLSEGFGLVVLEAMSQGLTVIVSDNTGACDVVTNGENGFIVPIRDAKSIAEAFERLHEDQNLLAAMKLAALGTARQMTWSAYRTNLIHSIDPLLGSAS